MRVKVITNKSARDEYGNQYEIDSQYLDELNKKAEELSLKIAKNYSQHDIEINTKSSYGIGEWFECEIISNGKVRIIPNENVSIAVEVEQDNMISKNSNIKSKFMKQLENKTTDIDGKFEEVERKATYADLLSMVMMQLTPGNTIAQQRKDFRVLDVIESAINENKELLIFEDNDYDYLKEKVKSAQWGFKNKGLFVLEDDVMAVKDKKEETT